jgi:uncharacterized protein
MGDPIHSVPLFLLNSVLFPQGILRLRVFEKRYVDMVRKCLREQQPFGVCLVTRTKSSSDAAKFESIGCLANIVDFDMEKMGLLLIRGIGSQRFQVLESNVQTDGLTTASIRLLEDDSMLNVPPQYNNCAALAKELVTELKRTLPSNNGDQLIVEPYHFDSAAWVANRLSEVLPISAQAKQKLMALDDPIARLKLVNQYLQDQKVLG